MPVHKDLRFGAQVLCFQFSKSAQSSSHRFMKNYIDALALARANELFDYMPIIDRLKPFRIIRSHLLNARA